MDGIWLFLVPVETEVDIQLAQTMCGVIGVEQANFGVRRIFARISLNFPEKFLCAFCQQIFSHKEHEDLFLV